MGAATGAVGWLDMTIATSDKSSLGRGRQGEKLDLLLRMRERDFLLQYHPSDGTTWTGDTHIETNILPSSRLFTEVALTVKLLF